MTWIQTYTGLPLDLMDPMPSSICIRDIAHALSNLARYTGHCHRFYSVAEHSVLMSRIFDDEPALAREALLHDAHEAYVGDVSAPLKHLPEMAPFRRIERLVDLTIRAKYQLPAQASPVIKRADLRMLETERRQILGPEPRPWGIDADPYPDIALPCWAPDGAKEAFLRRWEDVQP